MCAVNLAKLSANGLITVPVEVRRRWGLSAGDKVLFIENNNGETVLANASLSTLAKAQGAFAGAADDLGVGDPHDVQDLVDELRPTDRRS